MSEMRGPVDESDLHSRIDGRLAPDRAAAVDAYLAEHPEEKERFARYAEQRAALRALFGAAAEEPIPARLRVDAVRAGQRRHWRQQLTRAAAAIGFLVLGGLGGWALRDLASAVAPNALAAAEQEVTNDAIAAHRTFSPELRHPVEVDATQEAHLVQWLSKRLGRQLVVPDLTAAGFQLMGGRLLPAENSLAAQFMYEKGKERLTLYLRSGIGGEAAFRYHEDNGIGAFYWSDEGFGYALAGKADRAVLLKVAELVYQQLSTDAAKGKSPPPGKPS
jgi:anti-sigma factor RsiW